MRAGITIGHSTISNDPVFDAPPSLWGRVDTDPPGRGFGVGANAAEKEVKIREKAGDGSASFVCQNVSD